LPGPQNIKKKIGQLIKGGVLLPINLFIWGSACYKLRMDKSFIDEFEAYSNESSAHYRSCLDNAMSFQLENFKKVPENLYHYVPSFKTLKSILATREMWCSHASDMADKMELKYGADLLLERIEFFEQENPGLSWNTKEFLSMAREAANPFRNIFTGDRDAYILSLTEDQDSDFHWKNYGCEGKGYRLKFRTDTSSWQSLIQHENIQLVRVIYDRQYQVSLIDELISFQCNYIRDIEERFKNNIAGMDASVAAVELLQYYVVSFKQGAGCEEDFSAENEWRVVYGMRWIGPSKFNVYKIATGRRFAAIPLKILNSVVQLYDVQPGANTELDDQKYFKRAIIRFHDWQKRRSTNP
jgi:hypothetical protein